MLIIKLTRTQLLQQERKLKEEKQRAKKLVKRPNSTKNNNKTKITPKTTRQKACNKNPKPNVKPSFRSNCGKKVLNKSQTIPRKQIQRKCVKPASKNNNNHGPKPRLMVGTKTKKINVSQNKSSGKKVLKKRQLTTTRAKPNTAKNFSCSNVRSKAPAVKIENKSKSVGLGAGPEHKKDFSEKVEKSDCCCSEKNKKDGDDQSCWMCRLSQRLGGKLIGNKTKLMK